MSYLKAKIDNGILKQHYQKGALRLLEIPVKDEYNNENQFFAFLSTLGGGMVDKDDYKQDFFISNSKSSIYSQSNQKIYKGFSSLKTTLDIKEGSSLVYHNDANIFYTNSNFISETKINISNDSNLFFLDGGYTGYAKDIFNCTMLTKIYKDYKLLYNDVFDYRIKKNLSLFFNFDYFYTILIKGGIDIINIYNSNLVANSSQIKDLSIVRIMSNDNDIAMNYINNIKQNFILKNNMINVKVNQF